jgi:hypothetical protein
LIVGAIPPPPALRPSKKAQKIPKWGFPLLPDLGSGHGEKMKNFNIFTKINMAGWRGGIRPR